MAYEHPNRHLYMFPAKDFTGAAAVYAVRGPKGKTGRLIDYGVQNTSVAFVDGSSTHPQVQVGNASTANAYGAVLTVLPGLNDGASVLTTAGVEEDETGFPVRTTYITLAELPADTPIRITTVQATGGSPAGTAQPFMIIDWQW
jgi:hypothetical protein